MFAKMEDSLVSKIMFTTYCLIDLCKAIKNKLTVKLTVKNYSDVIV